MSNHNEFDHEKQYLSDIEKATALSLETLALEQFKRTKVQYSDLTPAHRGNYKNNLQTVSLEDYQKILKLRQQSLEVQQQQSSTSNVSTPTPVVNSINPVIITPIPPPNVPSRRNSEIKQATQFLRHQDQQQQQQQQQQQPDLISFTSPTSNDKTHSNFEQMYEEIHRLNVRAHSVDATPQQSSYMNNNNNLNNNINNNINNNNINNNNNNIINNNLNMFPQYGFQQQYQQQQVPQHQQTLPTSNSMSGGLQIVPYNNSTSPLTITTTSSTTINNLENLNNKGPLTTEQLTQLYNMNTPSGVYGVQQQQQPPQQQRPMMSTIMQQQHQQPKMPYQINTTKSTDNILRTNNFNSGNFMSSFMPSIVPPPPHQQTTIQKSASTSATLPSLNTFNSFNQKIIATVPTTTTAPTTTTLAQSSTQSQSLKSSAPPLNVNYDRRSFTPSPPPQPLELSSSSSSSALAPQIQSVPITIKNPQQQIFSLNNSDVNIQPKSNNQNNNQNNQMLFKQFNYDDFTASNNNFNNIKILGTLSQSTSAPSINTQASTSSASAAGGNNDVVFRRSGDLIDLDHGIEDNSRVSVLEAFDPLLISEQYDDKDDTASEYYSEYDPFDYLYSGGTQYSDPVYDAVNKTDKNALSPSGAPPIGWNIQTPSSTFSDYGFSTNYKKIPPPLPPRNTESPTTIQQLATTSSSNYLNKENSNELLDRRKQQRPTKLYENVLIKKIYDPELVSFYNMVHNIRDRYKYNDLITNIGHVVASEFPNNYPDKTSIKLLVHPTLKSLNNVNNKNTTNINNLSEINNGGGGVNGSGGSGGSSFDNNGKGQIEGYGPPVAFTCDINTTVEHVIMHVVCSLEGQILGSVDEFMLKPIGVIEWLSPTSKLNQLECVHNSIKLEKDVQLGLCPKNQLNLNSIGRTQQDDIRDAEIKLEDILAHEPVSSMGYDNLMIILETLETEIDRLESSSSDVNPHTVLSCSGVSQAVKAICALLGAIETLEISQAIYTLKEVCSNGQSYGSGRESMYGGSKLNILSENGDYAEVSLRPKTFTEQIRYRCNQVRDAIQQLLELYSHAFRVDFCVNIPEFKSAPKTLSHVTQPVMIHIVCFHRIPPHWRYDDYLLGTQIYHGTRYIGDAIVAQCTNENTGTYPRLKFDSWLNFESIPVCTLPRESRLIFVLYGCTVEPAEGGDSKDNTNEGNQERKVTKIELGWCSIQFFDYARTMINGAYLLSLWPPTTDKYLGPAPAKGTHPHGDLYPVLGIEIPDYGGRIVFPEALQNSPSAPKLDFSSLDNNLQQDLIDTAEQGCYPSAVDKREVLWEKRYYLQGFPHALPKVLHAAHSWDFASLVDLHALINSWKPLSPLQAMELFLPRYPDLKVREYACKWFSAITNDQFIDYLPQLLQALKHDTYEGSPMAEMLLCRSLESPRIAHHLYWLLVHSLPGDSPQNTIEFTQHDNIDESLITQARYHRRNQMMLRALLAICGEKLSAKFLAQNMICKSLADVAQSVKQSKESLRQQTLIQGLEGVHQILLERPTSLPLGPGFEVTGVHSRTSGYFNSNTLPLKINFMGPDNEILPAIFKCGDDLQQDMLTLQLVKIMDKLWLKEGLDLKMVTFNCIPTGYKKGMIELVSDAETLRKIQVEWGLTGSFKDKPIAEWLARKNPSQLEYQRAVSNFTVSCAGYSVVTYILGICDRHNDNIMLKTSGHLFHIDFGKFLGDAQMFGNFKRDRTPFVLTSDMAYVINGGDKPSTKFHYFVDLCCKAFNIVRKHGDLILHMLALMATSGIPGVTADAVTYVRKALLPGQSNPEAAASFAKMIQFSLKSWFTQFNFFLHNLAQIRFSSDDGTGELLSFVPRTYTMSQDGRLKSVTVHGYQKRYDLEKYYTYILKVTRQNQPDPAYLFRSYKEFLEFHQKLCLHYPLARLHSLQSGIYVGRSNIKTVADKRLPEIQHFLISLFNSADEIAHSHLVYTFFHPLLRDQQEADIHVKKVKDKKVTNQHESVNGMIKLSLQYHRGALTVMVHHARSLPMTNGQEPNTYVKCYLKPDPTKLTKRKTKVIKKNCFPSFMETLEYRMPLEYIVNRFLEVTVWSHDSLHENEFLGGLRLTLADFDLRDEILEWYTLGYLPRT